MGEYANKEWYLESSKILISEYGDVPPPWVYAPNSHPYSIGWRMGGGETHIMILGEWFEQQSMSFEQRLGYIKKYPAPPRWLHWVVDFLWEIDYESDLEDSDYLPYFTKLTELGFEGVDKFDEDMEDERWE